MGSLRTLHNPDRRREWESVVAILRSKGFACDWNKMAESGCIESERGTWAIEVFGSGTNMDRWLAQLYELPKNTDDEPKARVVCGMGKDPNFPDFLKGLLKMIADNVND